MEAWDNQGVRTISIKASLHAELLGLLGVLAGAQARQSGACVQLGRPWPALNGPPGCTRQI